jgi:uncharacterized protein
MAAVSWAPGEFARAARVEAASFRSREPAMRHPLHAFLVRAAIVAASAASVAGWAATPSFDCAGRVNAAQQLICGDDALAALDRKLGDVFGRAAKSLPNDKSIAYFVAEQRDWVRSRDGCPTTPNPQACLSSVYRTRIAELQGRFRMVPARGPFRFACDGTPPRDVVVTWFDTDPPSGTLETRDGMTPIFETTSGSGTRYVGDDIAFSEHQGTATLTYGVTAQELNCRQKP